MKTFLLIVLIVNGFSLLYAIWSYIRHRRAGTPLPVYQEGSISGTLGMMLMLASMTKGIDEQLAKWLLGVALALAAWSITLVVRARGRERTRVKQ